MAEGTIQDGTIAHQVVDADGKEVAKAIVGLASIHDHKPSAPKKAARKTEE